MRRNIKKKMQSFSHFVEKTLDFKKNLRYVHTNLGYYFEKQNFKNNSMVVGLEVGLSYQLPYQFRIMATGGMNLFTVNNKHNLGSSIYPVFGQISLVYAFKQIYR